MSHEQELERLVAARSKPWIVICQQSVPIECAENEMLLVAKQAYVMGLKRAREVIDGLDELPIVNSTMKYGIGQKTPQEDPVKFVCRGAALMRIAISDTVQSEISKLEGEGKS